MKTLIFVAVDMESANAAINDQPWREQVSNPILQVNKVLTRNVIDEDDTLVHINIGCFQRLQKRPIYILLLFSLE